MVVKSLEDQVLPSTDLTTPRLCRGWSQSGRVRVTALLGGRSKDTPSAQLFVADDCC